MRRQRERGRNDPVEALSALEAQVVSDHQEVQTGLCGAPEDETRSLGVQLEDRVVDSQTNPDHRLTRSRAMTRFWISAVPSAIR